MPKKYVIIGDGIAGATAAETIRAEKEDAEIQVFTDEENALYNRIMLKNYMKGTLPKQYTQMHDEDWYEKKDIELKLEKPIRQADTENKKVQTEDEEYPYDKLLVATGGSPRKMPQDEGYDNLHYMWSMNDATAIKESAEQAEEAVVIGGGLLGIDLAMAYAENDCETYYLIREGNWWSRGLDKKGAEIIHRKMREKGVNVITDTEVEELKSENNNKVREVVSKDGQVFECDAVAVAIGQTPNSEFVDVDKNDQDMIKTGEFLETSREDVYAAGNMVEYYSPVFERRTVNGSWDHSEAMGRAAARNMLGGREEFDFVNSYGVGHFDVQFLAIGDWEGEVVEEKYSEDEYRRLFFKDDRLAGAVMIGYTKGQEKLKNLIKKKSLIEDKSGLLARD
jgi:NAD(P)H-nitrite reductase large subunit